MREGVRLGDTQAAAYACLMWACMTVLTGYSLIADDPLALICAVVAAVGNTAIALVNALLDHRERADR